MEYTIEMTWKVLNFIHEICIYSNHSNFVNLGEVVSTIKEKREDFHIVNLPLECALSLAFFSQFNFQIFLFPHPHHLNYNLMRAWEEKKQHCSRSEARKCFYSIKLIEFFRMKNPFSTLVSSTLSRLPHNLLFFASSSNVVDIDRSEKSSKFDFIDENKTVAEGCCDETEALKLFLPWNL